MKLKAIVFVLTLCSSFALNAETERDNLVRLYKESNLKANTVMIGDSITFGGIWPDLLSNNTVANRGIGGDTSAQILARMDSILQLKPKKAFLMFGINDFGQGLSVEQTFLNYQKIVSILKKANIKVYISSTLLCNPENGCVTGESINEKINRLNKYLQDFAKANNITYIDINKKLANSQKLSPAYTMDGVHLNIAGYKEWSKLLSPYLR